MRKNSKKPYILGIIPARGGSKRLPGKNVRLLAGRPLIDYAIKVGLRSNKLDKLVVTTDSKRIRKIAVKSGACAPFLRPKALAKDSSPTEEALRHAVLFMERALGRDIDIIVLLEATCPFTTLNMIDRTIELVLSRDWDAAITVRPAPVRAEWIGTIGQEGVFKEIIAAKEYFNLAKIKEYVPSGNVYVFKRKVLFGQKKIISKNTGTVIVPSEYTVNIDYLKDFMFAEFMLKMKIVDLS
jgi:CMP-N,N'-diacetyllegionaminic acid synthase